MYLYLYLTVSENLKVNSLRIKSELVIEGEKVLRK
jgi:hypothetical protein